MYYKTKIPLEYEAIQYHAQYLNLHDDELLIHDFYHLSKDYHLGFLERFLESMWLKKRVNQSKKIFVFSEYIQKELCKIFPQAVDKISIMRPLVNEALKPTDDDARDVVRYQYAEGNAYFLYLGPIHPGANLINLLKGFSLFKKRLGSNMKLVLCGSTGKYSKSFFDALETYKYREDIIVTGKLNTMEEADILSAAYALIYPCKWVRFGIPIFNAMKAGVAILTAENSTHSEMAGMAGMFFNENDPNDIGEKMIRIYRDEQIRSDMIGTGLVYVKG